MTVTCTNPDCPNVDVDCDVGDALAAYQIICGECGATLSPGEDQQ